MEDSFISQCFEKFKKQFEDSKFTAIPSPCEMWSSLAKYLYFKLANPSNRLKRHDRNDKALQCLIAFLFQTMDNPAKKLLGAGSLEVYYFDKYFVKNGLKIWTDIEDNEYLEISVEQHVYKILVENLHQSDTNLASIAREEIGREPLEYNNEFDTFLTAQEIDRCKEIFKHNIPKFYEERQKKREQREKRAKRLLDYDDYDSYDYDSYDETD